MTMTSIVEAAAAKLNGNQYGKEGSKDLFEAMDTAGLVAVFGASDDLMELRGAINDEVGCYNGGTAYLTPDGLLQNDCENEECPHFIKLKEKAATVTAKWDDGGFSWRYETEIPHVKFTIKEDDENYCEGIVFALADVPAA
jgi:hypothetical protein